MSSIRFSARLDDCPGWAYLTIETPSRTIEATCSYLDDTFTRLVDGLCDLTERSGSLSVDTFSENKTDWKLLVRRRGDCVLLKAKGSPCGIERQNARVRLRYEGSWREFASAVVDAFDELLGEFGTDGYELRWGHGFPTEALERVRASI